MDHSGGTGSWKKEIKRREVTGIRDGDFVEEGCRLLERKEKQRVQGLIQLFSSLYFSDCNCLNILL